MLPGAFDEIRCNSNIKCPVSFVAKDVDIVLFVGHFSWFDIPVEAGIPYFQMIVDSRLRGSDTSWAFLPHQNKLWAVSIGYLLFGKTLK